MAGNKSTGRAKSCVVCRQFKLACDARKTAPDPCSRCVSKNLKCRFDPNFKRISTRKIAQEVADELHTLRAAQSTDSASQISGTPHSQMIVGGQSPAPFQATSHASVSSNSSSSGQRNSDSSQLQWLELADDEIVLDQTVHGVFVSSTRILTLFYHFGRYHFPHARFMPKLTSINRLAVKSPLLFITILVITAERYDADSDGLYEQLCNIHDLLTADFSHKAIQSIHVVHALLLLCLWPIPRLRNAYDPSWNYVALATSAALALNCHAPLSKDAPTVHFRALTDMTAAEMDSANQAMTWIACYEIGVRLGAYLGLPPPLSMPQHAKTLRRSQQLASSILTPADRASIGILDVLSCAHSHLDSIEDNLAQFSMIQTYEMRFDAINSQFKEIWTDTLDAQLSAAKIYVLGIALTQDLPTDEEQLSQAFLYRQLILEKCMKVSSGFISTMTSLSNQSIPSRRYPGGVLIFYPKYYFTCLMATVTFLFRFILAFQGATQAQQSQVVVRMTEAHKIFQSFPDHRDAMRACIHIETLVNVIKRNAVSESSLGTEVLVKNRLGASVVHDALFRTAEQRNRHPVDGSSPPVSQWTMMGYDSGHRLPLAPEQKVVSPKGQSISSSYVSPGEQQPLDIAPWVGVWDDYLNEFGVLGEPWVQDDDEFAMTGLQVQATVPSITVTHGYTLPTGSVMSN